MSDSTKRDAKDVIKDMESIDRQIRDVRSYAGAYIKDGKLIGMLDKMSTDAKSTAEYIRGRLDHADQPKR